MANPLSRLATLGAQLAPRGGAGGADAGPPLAQLSRAPTSGAVKGLPRFDPYIMETYLDDLRDLKRQVYDLFKFKPELLPAVEEGMSKGGAPAPRPPSPLMRCAAAHPRARASSCRARALLTAQRARRHTGAGRGSGSPPRPCRQAARHRSCSHRPGAARPRRAPPPSRSAFKRAAEREARCWPTAHSPRETHTDCSLAFLYPSPAEEHRSLVRAQLRALLEAGVNPLTYFDRDYKKYFYLAGERVTLDS